MQVEDVKQAHAAEEEEEHEHQDEDEAWMHEGAGVESDRPATTTATTPGSSGRRKRGQKEARGSSGFVLDAGRAAG